MSDRTKPNTQQVARAGERFAAAELHRRGAYAVVFSGNMPGIDVLVSDRRQMRTVVLQVKTKTSGTWHTTITRGRIREPVHDETRLWVFVDLAEPPRPSRDDLWRGLSVGTVGARMRASHAVAAQVTARSRMST